MRYLTILKTLIVVAQVRAHADNDVLFSLFQRDNDFSIPTKHYTRQALSSRHLVATNNRMHKRDIEDEWSLILPRGGKAPPQKQGSGDAKKQAGSRLEQQQGENLRPFSQGKASSSSSSNAAKDPRRQTLGKKISKMMTIPEGNPETDSTNKPEKKGQDLPKLSQPLNRGPSPYQIRTPERSKSPKPKGSNISDKVKERSRSSNSGVFKIGSPEKKILGSRPSSQASGKSEEMLQGLVHRMPRYQSPEMKQGSAGPLSAGSDRSDKLKNLFSTQELSPLNSPSTKTKPSLESDTAEKLKQKHLFSTLQADPFSSSNAKTKSSTGSDVSEKLKQEHLFSTMQLSPSNSPDRKPKSSIGSDLSEKLKEADIFSTQQLSPFQTPDKKIKSGTASDESDKSARLQSTEETPPKSYTPWQSPVVKLPSEKPRASRRLNE